MFLIQQLFGTCGIHLERKASICAECHMSSLRIYVIAGLKCAGEYRNRGSERAQFTSDGGPRG
jgi:hypothetical protein